MIFHINWVFYKYYLDNLLCYILYLNISYLNIAVLLISFHINEISYLTYYTYAMKYIKLTYFYLLFSIYYKVRWNRTHLPWFIYKNYTISIVLHYLEF